MAIKQAVRYGTIDLCPILDFEDETTTATYRMVQFGLLKTFELGMPGQKAPKRVHEYSLRFGEDDLAIEVDGDRAEARLQADLHDGGETLVWSFDATIQLEKRDGEWKFVRSSHRTASGSPPR